MHGVVTAAMQCVVWTGVLILVVSSTYNACAAGRQLVFHLGKHRLRPLPVSVQLTWASLLLMH
jgi:hypothetical protein